MIRTILLALGLTTILSAEEVRLYTERHYAADKTIFEEFTAKTGIEVKVVKAGGNELLALMKAEKDAPQGDLYIAVDAAALDRANQADLLTPVSNQDILARIPQGFLPENKSWLPITMRARVIVYAKDRIKPEDAPKTYADLADPQWKGKVLIRSSSSHYNQALLASILASKGKSDALKWAQGVKDNMARPPQGGDRDQVRALAQGLGDIAVSNSYYLGLLENADDEKDKAARAAVNIVFPNQDERGTHVNISGGGLIKGAANTENATKLLEYLTSPEVQAQYQKLTSEFAVIADLEPEPLQKAWGEFKPDYQSLHELSGHHEEAVKLFDVVGWP
ncbi:MAG: extracellular solute-binding protein [Verrucomicrobiota bacterium]